MMRDGGGDGGGGMEMLSASLPAAPVVVATCVVFLDSSLILAVTS